MWLDEEIEDDEEDCGVENWSGRNFEREQGGEYFLFGLEESEGYKMAKIVKLRQ